MNNITTKPLPRKRLSRDAKMVLRKRWKAAMLELEGCQMHPLSECDGPRVESSVRESDGRDAGIGLG